MRTAPALAVVLLLIAITASAQPLSCTYRTNSVVFRAESISDPIGDVFIQCLAGPTPATGQSYLTSDVQIFLTTNAANRIISNASAITTDAVLIVNENHAAPTVASTLGGPNGLLPRPQLGELTGVNMIKWSGVRIPLPGAVAPDGSRFPSRTSIRITNLRVNPNQLGLSSTGVPTTVSLFGLSVADTAAIQGGTDQVLLGTVQASNLLTSSVAAAGLSACRTMNVVGSAVNGPPTFTVRLTEGFAYAFRPLGTPVTDQAPHPGEAGYPIPGLGANGGTATQGTRIMLVLNNVPAGVRLAVPTVLTMGRLSMRLVQTDSNGNGAFNPVTSAGLAEVSVLSGSAGIVYEVTTSDNEVVESIEVPVTVAFVVDADQSPVTRVVALVSTSYAPISIFSTPSSAASIPRFVPSASPRNAFTINPCTTPPQLNSVTPTSTSAGLGIPVTLQATGSNLVGFPSIDFDGQALPTGGGSGSATSYGGALIATVPPELLLRPRTVPLTILNPDGQRSNKIDFTITAPAAPAISAGGVVSAATGKPGLAPGGLGSIYGTTLSSTTVSAPGLPLPTRLGNVSVLMGGRQAPLYFVSPSQINFQVPFEVGPQAAVPVTVTRDSVASTPVTALIQDFAPGIFRSGAAGIVVHADYSLVTTLEPAAAGETLIAFGTGLGGLANRPATGAGAPSNPAATAPFPTITVGGAPAQALYAGLAAGFVGLAQFNFRMPGTLPAGKTLDLKIAYGVASDTFPLATDSPAAAPPFNLKITSILPVTPIPTDNIGVDFSLTNNGPAPALVRVYVLSALGAMTNVTVADAALVSSDPFEVPVGTTDYFYPGVPLSPGVNPGRQYIAVGVRPDGDQDNSHTILSPTASFSVVAARPEFDVSVRADSISPTTVAAGGRFAFAYTITERTGLSGTFLRRLFISPRPVVTTSDTVINARTFDLLEGEYSVTSTGNVVPSTLAPGNYWVAVEVFAPGDINQANNISVGLPVTIVRGSGVLPFARPAPESRPEGPGGIRRVQR